MTDQPATPLPSPSEASERCPFCGAPLEQDDTSCGVCHLPLHRSNTPPR